MIPPVARKRGPAAQRPAAGFTLLEVLLAAALAVVLLAGLWSLLSTYERLFSKGQAKVEQAQLVRVLFDQLSEDLRSAIPDTATALPGASSSVRRFGLFGTERSLQVDVLQVAASQVIAAAAEAEGPAWKPPRPLQVPELRTVQYWLEGAADSGFAEGAVRQGLVRRELDWETPVAESVPGAPPSPPTAEDAETGAEKDPTLAVPADPTGVAPFRAEPSGPALLRVPEVAGLEFRYYDGSGWSGQWNSLQRKSLPVAVEIVLRFNAGDAPSPRQPGGPGSLSEEDAMALLLGEETAARLAGPSYRLLVFLPSTGLAHAPKDAAAEMLEMLAIPEVPPADQAPPPLLEPPPLPVFVPPPVFEPPPVPESEPPMFEPPPAPGRRAGELGRPLAPGSLPDEWMRRGR